MSQSCRVLEEGPSLAKVAQVGMFPHSSVLRQLQFLANFSFPITCTDLTTWQEALGHWDTGTPGHWYTGTPETGKPGHQRLEHRDTKTLGHRDTRHRDTGTSGLGNRDTRDWDTGTPRHWDTGTVWHRGATTCYIVYSCHRYKFNLRNPVPSKSYWNMHNSKTEEARLFYQRLRSLVDQ